jgi:rod shape-determining protein MreC
MRDSRRTRVVLAILLLVSLTLITIDLRGGDDSAVDGPRGFVASVFAPIESAAAAIVRPVSGAITAIGNIGRSQDKIDDLTRERDELETELRTRPYDQKRVDELDALLELSAAGRYRTVPAQVIAVGAGQGFAWTATIDVGSSDGIKIDQTVINGQGLVGRVKRVTASTATVILAIDPTSTVGARVEGSSELGLLEGRGGDPMELQLLDPQKEIEAGDRIVTFGSRTGRPYVPGVPVGEVTSVRGTPGSLSRIATVDPYVSFTALDIVGVVVAPPREDPRDAVLPRPSPTPTVTVTVTAPPSRTDDEGGSDAGSSPTPSPGATR